MFSKLIKAGADQYHLVIVSLLDLYRSDFMDRTLSTLLLWRRDKCVKLERTLHPQYFEYNTRFKLLMAEYKN